MKGNNSAAPIWMSKEGMTANLSLADETEAK